MEWLAGKKTYIIGAIMFVVGGLYAIRGLGVPYISEIDEATWRSVMDWLQMLLGGAGLAALRAGVAKAER